MRRSGTKEDGFRFEYRAEALGFILQFSAEAVGLRVSGVALQDFCLSGGSCFTAVRSRVGLWFVSHPVAADAHPFYCADSCPTTNALRGLTSSAFPRAPSVFMYRLPALGPKPYQQTFPGYLESYGLL